MRYLILSLTLLVLSGCSVYFSAPTPDDLYYSNSMPTPSPGYVDQDRGYLRMRATSDRWRAFDDDFYYWNFGPGLVGVGDPLGGWNTWRWYSPGFPYYGSGPHPLYGYPWYGAVPYSIYGGWGAWPARPWGIGGAWYGQTWNPYTRQNVLGRDAWRAPGRQSSAPRQVNLGAYGTNAPRQQSGSGSPVRTFGQQGQSTQSGSPARAFGQPGPAYQPRSSTQGQPSPVRGAPVRKFDRP